MRRPDKARLRNALKKLRAIPYVSVEPAETRLAAQEALDFLALLAGIKPVYVLGRGLDDPEWRDGVLELAAAHKLFVSDGPYWIAPDAVADLPEWFVEATLSETSGLTAHYIAKAKAVDRDVRRIAETGDITVADEARLLGFPLCCVTEHYARARTIHGTSYAIVARVGGGDGEEMEEQIDTFSLLEQANDDERAAFAEAISLIPCPFTSLNMCVVCADDPDSPAAQLARRYAELAHAVDPALYDMLSPEE